MSVHDASQVHGRESEEAQEPAARPAPPPVYRAVVADLHEHDESGDGRTAEG